MNKKFFRDLVPLVAICLVAALLLAVFNMITEGPIAENALRAAQETRARLLPAAASFEAVDTEGSAMDSCYQGFDAAGESVGYVVETTVGGYAGEIVVTVGVAADNTITGISVGGDNFSETAGLGAKAKEASFTDQFIGESVPLSLQKGTSGLNDGIIDAISGATITSTAVNGGVNSAGKFVMDLSGEGASPNTASVQGFAGPVAVTLMLDDAGAITEITIGDDFFNETPGFGAAALEESFQAQFIGKIPPLSLADIDAISGATITSTAVVNAINQVQAQLSGAAPVSAPAEELAPVPAAGENALKASAQGFAGPVAVAVDLDESGAVTAISIGDENFAETPGFGAKAQDDAFKAQFIGKTLPVSADDVDAIAGATITTNAVIEALNGAAGFEAPVEEVVAVPAAGETALKAKAQGFAGPVAVAVDLDENGAITAITIGDESFAETPGFGAKAQEDVFKTQFIGKALPVDVADIDAIAGATITTNAVIEALNNLAVTEEVAEEIVEESNEEKLAEDTLNASAQGFAGPVYVEITLDGDAISSIVIGDENFAETPGFGAKAQEDAFKAQFIGKTLPVNAADIDAIAGATITTNAVIEALNSLAVNEEVVEAVTEEETVEDKFSASAQGFAGPVYVEITLDDDTISSIVIGDESFAETPGFGAKAQEDAFKAQFIGKTLPVNAADIDAITGATITTNAVIDALNSLAVTEEVVTEEEIEEVTEETSEEKPVEYKLSASAQGFAGPVYVEITLDDGAISSITIGDENFAETPGFGAKALEDAFKNQFIGKTLPVAADDIDSIAGATITTNAVIEALNSLAVTEEVAEEIVEESNEEKLAEETLNASAQGFAGPVYVEITLDGDAISSIVIGDESFAETPGFGAKAQEDAFKAQFIGKTLPVNAADIDAIAGATITTNAVIDALNSLAVTEDVVTEEVIEEATEETTEELIEEVTEEATEDKPVEDKFSASAQGFAGPVYVEITLDDDTISSIVIGDESFAETPGFGAKAQEDAFKAQFIGKTLPVDVADIDAIAGATITTNAVIEALNSFAVTEEEIEEVTEETSEEKPVEDKLSASAQGFAGPVYVEITLDDGAISYIVIGDESFAETPGFGAKAQEDAFKAQFIGKTLPVNAADIDAIAGATITTNAVIDALNSLAVTEEVVTEEVIEEATEETTEEKPVENKRSASAQGFAGPVYVEITLDGDTISSIVIGDESFAETPGFGAKAQEDAFKTQFIGKTLPVAADDIDSIAGATITTNAVIEALNQIAQQLTAE